MRNLIRIDPDTPVYRTFRLRYFREVLREGALTLVAPHLWDDPFENFLSSCAVTYLKGGQCKQEFFDQVRRPVYAQCWSLAVESDALWRIYSTVAKDPATGRNKSVEDEGVKVRTTARKLLNTLWQGSPAPPEDTCFLGLVDYMPQKQAAQWIANEVGREHLNAFSGGLGHAVVLLIKRESFEHEREVRLIFVQNTEDHDGSSLLQIPIDPVVFEEAVFDPRLHPDDIRAREAELRSLGFTGNMSQSSLYRKTLYEIIVK